jgi:hypothetical protein
MQFQLLVKHRETGDYEMFMEGDAKSRRKFMTAMGQSRRVKNEFNYRYWGPVTGHIAILMRDKRQWRAVAVG